jgi:hypothetical protein
MKLQVCTFILLALGGAKANTIVKWYGCGGEYQQTETTDKGCTNVKGFKNTNLCSVFVPPPGTDHCEFYTTRCWIPWGDTYKCSVASGKCNARSWKAIESYRCWTK